MIEITRKQVAEMLEVDVRSITNFQNQDIDPLPVAVPAKRGGTNIYDAIAIHKWGIRKRLAELDIGDDGNVYDYNVERARLAHHQANNEALKEKELRRELMNVDEVERLVSQTVLAARSKLLSLPTKMAGKVQFISELPIIEGLLRDSVDEALHELAASIFNIETEDDGLDSATSETAG